MDGTGLPRQDRRDLLYPSVLAEIRGIVRDVFGFEDGRLHPGASFADDLGTDSIDMLEIVQAVEDRFGFEMPDAEAERVLRVGDLVAAVQRHGRTPEAAP